MLVEGKPHEAASRDTSRPVLCNVHLQTDPDGSRWLEATDSYCLVRVPVSDADEDEDGMIPAAAVKAATAPRAPGRVAANGHVEAIGKDGAVTRYDRPDGIFPNCRQLIPDAEPVFEFGVNVDLLVKVAKAIGTSQVRLSFVPARDADGPSNLRPISVRALQGGVHEARGLVMPIRLSS